MSDCAYCDSTYVSFGKNSGAEKDEGFEATLVQIPLKSLRQPLKGLYLRLLNEHAGSSNVCREVLRDEHQQIKIQVPKD